MLHQLHHCIGCVAKKRKRRKKDSHEHGFLLLVQNLVVRWAWLLFSCSKLGPCPP